MAERINNKLDFLRTNALRISDIDIIPCADWQRLASFKIRPVPAGFFLPPGLPTWQRHPTGQVDYSHNPPCFSIAARFQSFSDLGEFSNKNRWQSLVVLALAFGMELVLGLSVIAGMAKGAIISATDHGSIQRFFVNRAEGLLFQFPGQIHIGFPFKRHIFLWAGKNRW